MRTATKMRPRSDLEGSSVSLGGARAVALGRFDAGGDASASGAAARLGAVHELDMVGVVVFAIRQRGRGRCRETRRPPRQSVGRAEAGG